MGLVGRLFIVCLVAFACGACTQVYNVPSSTPGDAALITRYTVALVEDGDHVYCSGEWVSEDTILTANHCDPEDEIGAFVSYATRDDVVRDGEKFAAVHTATIVKRDSEHDLLLLRATRVSLHPYARVGADPFVGDAVQTMGHPLGLWWSYSTGVIAAVRRVDVGDDAIDPDMVWTQSTAPISPGNSGGGLYTVAGELVGICSRGLRSGQNLNLYVSARYVRAFLASAA